MGAFSQFRAIPCEQSFHTSLSAYMGKTRTNEIEILLWIFLLLSFE